MHPNAPTFLHLLGTLALRARTFADSAHDSAGRHYNGAPYIVHCDAVAEILLRAGVDPLSGPGEVLLAAAFLHDVVEDTSVTVDEVRTMFGDEVAAIVDVVTNPPVAARAARFAVSLPRIRATPAAIPVKQADRLANATAATTHPKGSHARKYAGEYAGFRTALWREDCPPLEVVLWAALDQIQPALEARGRQPDAPAMHGTPRTAR